MDRLEQIKSDLAVGNVSLTDQPVNHLRWAVGEIERLDYRLSYLLGIEEECADLKERLRAASGGCRILSEGARCDCGLCERDREIERLQAIVDKLPKTADGVPVVPGKDYWCSWVEESYDDPGGSITEIRKCRYVGHASPHVDYDWEITDCPWDGGQSPPGFAIYSTREAAEASS